MKDKSKLKSVSIQAKVSALTAERLDKIVVDYRFESRYELVQYIISAFLKFADPQIDGLNEEYKEYDEFAKIFEGFENQKERIISTRPNRPTAMKVTELVAILSLQGKKGYVCRNISYRGDDASTTANKDKSLEVVVRRLFPIIANQLQDIGRVIDMTRYEDILSYLIECAEEKLNGIQRGEVADNFREYSQGIIYGKVPKKNRERKIE